MERGKEILMLFVRMGEGKRSRLQGLRIFNTCLFFLCIKK